MIQTRRYNANIKSNYLVNTDLSPKGVYNQLDILVLPSFVPKLYLLKKRYDDQHFYPIWDKVRKTLIRVTNLKRLHR